MKALLAVLFLLATVPALAEPPIGPDTPLADPAAEARAKALMEELRCLTCQNQSIVDSNAPQAQSMRVEVRQRIADGKPPEAVRALFIERYGDWVSFQPPARAETALLWAAPVLFLLLGGIMLARRIRR